MKKRIIFLNLGGFVALVVVFVGWVYLMFNGTPWGKVAAQRQLIATLNADYKGMQYTVFLPASYNFKTRGYDIGVSFSKRPDIKYFFELNQKTHDARFFGTNNSSAPIPQPGSSTWLDK